LPVPSGAPSRRAAVNGSLPEDSARDKPIFYDAASNQRRTRPRRRSDVAGIAERQPLTLTPSANAAQRLDE
jgi:hypothetical protein